MPSWSEQHLVFHSTLIRGKKNKVEGYVKKKSKVEGYVCLEVAMLGFWVCFCCFFGFFWLRLVSF